MKRFLSLLLILFCLGTAVACRADENDRDILTPYFTGKVIEVYEKGCLLEVTNNGNQHFALGDEVVVHTNMEDCPPYAVGDFLRIVFDGTIAESYPPQIHKVYSIHKTDGIGNSVE